MTSCSNVAAMERFVADCERRHTTGSSAETRSRARLRLKYRINPEAKCFRDTITFKVNTEPKTSRNLVFPCGYNYMYFKVAISKCHREYFMWLQAN